MIARRLSKLSAGLRRHRCQAALISGVSDVRYLSGFSGDDSWLLIGRDDEPVLLTDSRYTEQARAEAPQYRVVQRREPLAHRAARILASLKAERIAFDPDMLTVRAYEAVRERLPKSKLVSVNGLIGALRQVKDAAEIKILREAVLIAEQAYRRLVPEIQPGLSEKELADRLEIHLRACGAQKAAFDTIVAARERASLAHARPTERLIAPGDSLLIDWGAYHELYCSDLTRVTFSGKIPESLREVYSIVLEAQRRAIRQIRPGIPISEVDAAARDHIAKAGYGKHFGHGLGHGVGLDVHELPHVGPTAEGTLKAGMVFTVEPAIYLPGRGGVRIEDVALVTRDGCELLSSLEKDFV